MRFEWDKNKANANVQKHQISFEIAQEIFYKEEVLAFEDTRFNYKEVREIALGEVEGIILYVMFTVREDRIRIISARKATEKEAKGYYDYFTKGTDRHSPEDDR